MKKIFALAGTALLVVGLASCSSNSSAAPTQTPTYTPEPTPTYTPPPTQTPKPTPKYTPKPTYTKDEIFVSVIRNQYPYYASLYSNAELVQIGKLTCQYFDDGGTFEELAYYLVTTIDATDDAYGFMGFTIGAAVATYCPSYTYLVS